MNKTNRITRGVYSNFRIVKSRNVAEVCIEIPLEQGEEFVQMFGMPNPEGSKWLAIAALDKPKVADYEEGMRAIQQCALICKQEKFGIFLKTIKNVEEVNPFDEESITRGLKAILGISSRKELKNRQVRIGYNRLINEYEQFCLKSQKS